MIVIKKNTLIIIAVLMASAFAFIFCFASLGTKDAVARANKITVIVDAGHGGIDGGVSGKTSGKKESELNLDIANKLNNYLCNAGFNGVLTRKTDAGLYGFASSTLKQKDMKARKEIIQKNSPDFVVSIHMNKYPLSSRRGGQVFYNPKTENCLNFAKSVQDQLNVLYSGVKDYSPLSGDYFILKCSDCPSIIVECGFLSNEQDEMLLLTEEFREEIAYSVFKGIVNYVELNT